MSKTYKRKHGTLRIVGGLLLCSALIRISISGTPLIAQTYANPPEKEAQSSSLEPTMEVNAELLAVLQERERQVKEKEYKLADQEQAIEISKAEIDEKLAELIAAEDALRNTLALADSATQKDLKRLALVYENMKAKDTAELFTQMEPEFAAGFLGLMNPEAAAAVMTQLEAPTAYAISVMLASRNASVPTQ